MTPLDAFISSALEGADVSEGQWDEVLPLMSIGRWLDLKDRWSKARLEKKRAALVEACTAPIDPARDSMTQLMERNNMLLSAILVKLP